MQDSISVFNVVEFDISEKQVSSAASLKDVRLLDFKVILCGVRLGLRRYFMVQMRKLTIWKLVTVSSLTVLGCFSAASNAQECSLFPSHSRGPC